MDTVVLKFGGASVSTPEHFATIAELVLFKKRMYPKIVVVVSAMGNTTNELIELAKKVNPTPPRREYDMLVTVGERISISLLAMALYRKGEEAVSFTGSQSGIITTADHTEARIIDVRPRRLLKELEVGKIVIVAGFQGVSTEGEITTLGRGGSDTTAVALGVALQADYVEFYKDVKGVYSADPKKNKDAYFFEQLTYEEALAVIGSDGKVLHSRSIDLARKNFLPLRVRSFLENPETFTGTVISDPCSIKERQLFFEAEQALI